ncbi:hypothetical protein J2848_003618 [Azospirillum lipoferum]|uniref:Uncharacterized protein n=1 Tax=Azospirillum lipoferum TaxID=193 RepID=A0A5A9GL43_AZOLI|nr:MULTISPECIES: hypothetical protein [Azospirillum]KAA0595188.1 hypothetical protein FZ942_16225 [Azospirillum lipoferum]MCP1611940.1 hypothetical protein [Azospirillum lipoferum]MDW5533301.1 hypothetical protein [Azospirillum sp. NL1]
MRARTLATVAMSLTLATAPVFSGTAFAQTQTQPPIKGQVQAQPASVSGTIAALLPVSLWTITGAVIGAVAWPGLAAGTLTITPITSTAALWNTGAAVGAVAGGAGYLATR